MEQIITIILSSALVSGIVATLVGFIFENKKYLKEKKFLTYTNFLDQMDKTIPPEVVGDLRGEALIKTVKVECLKIERHVWQIKLISKNVEIHKRVDKIFNLLEKIVSLLLTNSKSPDKTKLKNIWNEITSEGDKLIQEMNKDINKFF